MESNYIQLDVYSTNYVCENTQGMRRQWPKHVSTQLIMMLMHIYHGIECKWETGVRMISYIASNCVVRMMYNIVWLYTHANIPTQSRQLNNWVRIDRCWVYLLYVHMIVAVLGMMKSDKHDIVYTIEVLNGCTLWCLHTSNATVLCPYHVYSVGRAQECMEVLPQVRSWIQLSNVCIVPGVR